MLWGRVRLALRPFSSSGEQAGTIGAWKLPVNHGRGAKGPKSPAPHGPLPQPHQY